MAVDSFIQVPTNLKDEQVVRRFLTATRDKINGWSNRSVLTELPTTASAEDTIAKINEIIKYLNKL